MLRKRSGEIEWLEFTLFQEIPHLVHGVFLRHGGVSSGEYTSLNTARGPGELPENVLQNFERIRLAMGLSAVYSAWQQHGKEIAHVEQGDRRGDLRRSPFEELPYCDALITAELDVGLLIKHADCQAAVIVDPVHRALANVHAGWRGNRLNIYRAVVERMQRVFGSRPEDLLVGISPSLGPEASEFIHYTNEFPRSFWEFQHRPNYFNLWELSRVQLEECGILPYHIEIASICTYAHPEDFFSYRRKKESGRHGTLAGFTAF